MHDPHDEFDDQLDELRRDLSELYTIELPVPNAVNERILNHARVELARPKFGRRRVLRWAGVAVAAAAVLLLVIWLNLSNTPSPSQVAVSIRGDVDGNGRVDILDALVLARRIDAEELRDLPDFNRDGKIDRADVDSIALAAVSLQRGGAQ